MALTSEDLKLASAAERGNRRSLGILLRNIVNSFTALSATELGFIDAVTAGTGAVSKALVLDASGNVAMPGTGKITNVIEPAEVVTATNVIAASESGSTFFLNSATEFVSTLPAPALGLNFKFVVAAAPSAASYTIVTNASANVIKGQVFTSDVNSATDADFETAGGDTITFVDSKAVAGDTVELVCDGTTWFARCYTSVFDGVTITTAS